MPQFCVLHVAGFSSGFGSLRNPQASLLNSAWTGCPHELCFSVSLGCITSSDASRVGRPSKRDWGLGTSQSRETPDPSHGGLAHAEGFPMMFSALSAVVLKLVPNAALRNHVKRSMALKRQREMAFLSQVVLEVPRSPGRGEELQLELFLCSLADPRKLSVRRFETSEQVRAAHKSRYSHSGRSEEVQGSGAAVC